MRPIVLASLLLLALASPAHADFSSALAAYERGDYGAAFQEFRVLADEGDADSQYMVGYLYGVGRGTPQSYVDAHKWFNLAASQGRPGAVKARDDVARLMTTDQIAEAQAEARAWRSITTTTAAARPKWAPPEEGAASRYGTAPSRETVAAIQRMLGELGYDAGTADGVAGAQTRQAIRQYQAAAGLSVDGRPSDAVHAHLAATVDERRAARLGPSPVPGVPGEADRTQELVDELLRLVETGERRHAAQPWLLRDLRALGERYHWPWRAELLRDDFRDGDFTANPTWTVAAGRFGVDFNVGLRTVVTPPPATAARREPEDLGARILGTILERVIQPEGREARTPAPDYAEIHVARAIPNAFALHAELTSRAGAGRLEIGPYQGESRTVGYRLVYTPGAEPGLALVRLSSYGSGVIEAHQRRVELEDRRAHTILWTRDETGTMVVVLDGEEVIRATDRGVMGAFDGLTVLNRGGDYGLREIVLYGAGSHAQ
ncbi:MAG: peptidoglycan-binding protein [Alphaproteobacteria bacterium]